jgi:23S rRNA (uracil1939-C5)-methyltransferase
VVTEFATHQPEVVICVSCNPATLARDLGVFNEQGYTIERIVPLDMFPQTYHIETVVKLRKR